MASRYSPSVLLRTSCISSLSQLSWHVLSSVLCLVNFFPHLHPCQISSPHRYWYSPSATQADRIGLFSANMAAPVPKEILVLPHNSSTSVLAVDESEQHLYYVRRTNTRPGVCGSWPGGVADNVVRVSLDGSGEEVLLEQPKGWCVGTASVALDSAGRKLYYNIVDQYVALVFRIFTACCLLAVSCECFTCILSPRSYRRAA